jgi:hypothetical protein
LKNIYKYLSEKVDKKGVPLRPFDIVQWAQNEPSRPLTTATLLAVAESIKGTVGNVDALGIYVPTSALVMDQIFSREIASASVPGLDDYKAYVLRFGVQLMVGLAINAINWDYSPIRFYNLANASEVQAGYTSDFMAKHISGTEDAKSARNVARERIKGADEKSVPALGRIVTTRSGAILKEDVPAFVKEIGSRQDEFTNTHARLCSYFGESWLTLAQGEGFQYLDGITFRTQHTYRMFEFEGGKGGGEGSYFLDFSLSSDQAGSGWAVHHLAGATVQNIPPGPRAIENVIGQRRGEAPVKPTTYMNANPFQGGRRPPGL